MRQWLMDCLECVALRNKNGIIVDLECAQLRPHCKKKPGMDDKYFNDKGVCSSYKESDPCDKNGRKMLAKK